MGRGTLEKVDTQITQVLAVRMSVNQKHSPTKPTKYDNQAVVDGHVSTEGVLGSSAKRHPDNLTCQPGVLIYKGTIMSEATSTV